ncbi:hypothetical protein BLJ79_17680 [Arthrobacter sp. UCD-GKA]|nr:hypothetical protein BLJ79_17680 [Arthrobacter sp. UCD-GKA]
MPEDLVYVDHGLTGRNHARPGPGPGRVSGRGHHGGKHTSAEIAEFFGVARSTVYRIAQRTSIK